jgi:hypothetical protein
LSYSQAGEFIARGTIILVKPGVEHLSLIGTAVPYCKEPQERSHSHPQIAEDFPPFKFYAVLHPINQRPGCMYYPKLWMALMLTLFPDVIAK